MFDSLEIGCDNRDQPLQILANSSASSDAAQLTRTVPILRERTDDNIWISFRVSRQRQRRIRLSSRDVCGTL